VEPNDRGVKGGLNRGGMSQRRKVFGKARRGGKKTCTKARKLRKGQKAPLSGLAKRKKRDGGGRIGQPEDKR